jgi:enterochelin esterase-like enzyme
MKPPEKKGVGRFRSADLSNPRFERDHVRNLTMHSPALAGRGDISLFVPPGAEALADVPIVLLLHGAYGSHGDWFQRGGAHLTALRLIQSGSMRPMIVACPSDGLKGDSTGYVAQRGADYEAWVSEDAIDAVRELFPCTGPRPHLLIAGLSMGGYGALRIGTKRAPKFEAIAAHSAATGPDPLARLTGDPDSYAHLPPEEFDILHWARRHKATLPPIRFDCGRDDFLFANNCALHERFQQAGIAHEFAIHDGAHDWDYWQTHIADTFMFFESVLVATKS